MTEQAITSADTSRKQVPAVYRRVKTLFGWQAGTHNLDLGGGKYDEFSALLFEKESVANYVLDPYNRSEGYNRAMLVHMAVHGAETVTISNVLNVIKEPAVRAFILKQADIYLNAGGRIYITVYEGDRSGKGRATRDGWQNNRPLRSYLGEVQKVYPDAYVKGGLIVVEKGAL